jgi:hypothetical protein
MIEKNLTLDFPFEMWFRHRLRYRPQVSANLGFCFGVEPKLKLWFWSYTTSVTRGPKISQTKTHELKLGTVI